MAAGNEGDGGSWAIVISVSALVLTLVAHVISAVWTLTRSGKQTDEKIADKNLAFTEAIAAAERRSQETINTALHAFGDTAAALRQKITDTELWNRDNFVSKRTFEVVVDDIRRSWERFEGALNERFDRLDRRLDRKIHGPKGEQE